ncbi:MAG TPA: hypothetical protein VFT72_18485 [Opitutaceae bacterium]|nr:hypothetical protein [Opitutaceae bacterium]
MQRFFRPLVYLVIPTAAFLTFLIQPIVGKELMPRYGGTAGTWMTVSLFFQTSLLGGYALAAWLLKQRRTRAHAFVLGLAALSPIVAKLPPWDFAGWAEWPGILAGLTLSLLPTLLLTTSIGIVVQGWIRDRHGEVPYALYGISNLGSLLALLIYPFKIEPFFGLGVQVRIVHGLLWLLSLGVACIVWLERRNAADLGLAASSGETAESESIGRAKLAGWIVIGFSTCTLMLGGVRVLSAEIGSNPLSWLIPLGAYLLSFTVTFSGWWRRSLTLGTLIALAFALFGYMSTKGFSSSVLSYWPRFWLIAMIITGSLAGHGLLYELRPQHRFTAFYLSVAIAGALAGLFASVGAPLVFDRNFEFSGAAFLIVIIVGGTLIARRGWMERTAFVLLAIGPAAWLGLDKILADHRLLVTKMTYLRNYYSSIVLTDTPAFITASNETTMHGAQLHDPAHTRVPTTYYTRGSGGGMVIQALQKKYPAIRIGVIGLGTGTLAAYPRAQDEIIFWDINPLAVRVARDYFTFLKECPGKVDVRVVDGRIGVRNAPERLDLLVVDAFSGDYIPLHLLTREALQEYVARVGDGIVLFHVSNRYTDLVPAIATSARRLGLHVRCVYASPNDNVAKSEQAARTRYVLVYPKSRDDEVDGWIMNQLNSPDYIYQISFPDESHVVDWTDDKHAIVDVLTAK